MNRFFAPGEEFSRIERMFAPDRFSAEAHGLGDDAFLWEEGGKTFAVTSDASAEGPHYRLDWVSPAGAMRKALAANLSDINAMGGRGLKAFFNLGARADWDASVFDALGAELRAMEEAHGFRVEGGDLVTLPATSFFSFAVIGEVEGAPLLRAACRPGHKVYVSGTLGGSAAGLKALRASGEAPDALRRAHLDPAPPLALGPLLASFRREVAAIDVSDGLSSELAHLARASGCALRVDAGSLPAHPALAGLAPADARDCILHGGEEYQLLFTGAFTPAELEALRTVAPIAEIGEAFAGEGVFLRENGIEAPLPARGWSH
jgi:thiamine-monophosphate kinase